MQNENPPEPGCANEMENPFELENIEKYLDVLGDILKENIAVQAKTKGRITLEQLQEQFEVGKGSKFKGEDGYYEITGGRSLNENNLIRIKSEGGIKTLWYPANLDDLEMMFRNMHKIIFGRAVDGSPNQEEDPENEKLFIRLAENKKREKEIWSNYQFIDFGCGDGRAAIVASMFGVPAKGLEIDSEMIKIARENVSSVRNKDIPLSQMEIESGSFLESETVKKIIGDGADRKPTIFYSYVTPMTGDLLNSIKPFLKEGDFILLYKEAIDRHPQFEKDMAGMLKKELETSRFMGSGANIYSINKKQG